MRDKARRKFGEIVLGQEFAVEDGKFLIGIVATNQPRKDWATGIKAVRNPYQNRRYIAMDSHGHDGAGERLVYLDAAP